MKLLASVAVFSLAFALPSAIARTTQPQDDFNDDNDDQYEVDVQDVSQQTGQASAQANGPQLPNRPQLLQQLPPAAIAPAPAPSAAQSAKDSATAAKKAAKAANKVAKKGKRIIGHAKKSLKHALGALHDARVDSAGLSKQQKKKLRKAEAHLREATKKAHFGKLQKLQNDLEKNKQVDEKEQMRSEIEGLRKQLKDKKADDKDTSRSLDDLEHGLDAKEGAVDDESKAELERLRQQVSSIEEPPQNETQAIEGNDGTQENVGGLKPLPTSDDAAPAQDEAVTPVQEKGIDIDTQMPYGDLEPFGREDTAQELTESSIRESDEMVDQLERAEVSEEKRAVFRALTRLRGAAITSFDGVARSQTGNIDEYNKIHAWRSTHPLHHLADEESDISKWAFPDNAD